MWGKQKGTNVNGDMIQNSIVIKNTAMDELKQFLQAGDYHSAMKLIGMQTDFIGTQHPYHPDYVIGIKDSDGKRILYSKPVSERAQTFMAPKLVGKFSFSERYTGFASVKDIFENSYFTQTDIDINLLEIKRMLGDHPDPFQEDLEQLLNGRSGEWKIKHEEFPPPKPYRVILKGHDISFDYILLQMKEVVGTTVVLSNYLQDTSMQIEFAFDLYKKSMSMNIRINDNYKFDYKAQLKFLKFVKIAMENCQLSVISLEEEVELASGMFSGFDYKSSFDNVDYEIEFIESVIMVESHYGKKIIVPEDVDEQSYSNLIYLAKGIAGGKVEGSWTELKAELTIIDGTRRNIEKIGDSSEKFTFEHKRNVTIFGDEYLVPRVLTHFLNAKIKDIYRLKEKLRVLDVGDTINVNFVPGDDNKYVEELFFQ